MYTIDCTSTNYRVILVHFVSARNNLIHVCDTFLINIEMELLNIPNYNLF